MRRQHAAPYLGIQTPTVPNRAAAQDRVHLPLLFADTTLSSVNVLASSFVTGNLCYQSAAGVGYVGNHYSLSNTASVATACVIYRPNHCAARAVRCLLAVYYSPVAAACNSRHPGNSWCSPATISPPLSQLVKRFKFQHAPELAPTQARLMLLSWLQARRELYLNKPDLILAAPLQAKRYWHRGYN